MPVERRSGAGLAPRMRQLHASARALRMDELRYGQYTQNVLLFPDAQIVRRNAALGGDGRGLKHDQARAALRPAAQMDEVPIRGEAVDARVLAHRRNADAIGEFNGAKLKARKKRSCHVSLDE